MCQEKEEIADKSTQSSTNLLKEACDLLQLLCSITYLVSYFSFSFTFSFCHLPDGSIKLKGSEKKKNYGLTKIATAKMQ